MRIQNKKKKIIEKKIDTHPKTKNFKVLMNLSLWALLFWLAIDVIRIALVCDPDDEYKYYKQGTKIMTNDDLYGGLLVKKRWLSFRDKCTISYLSDSLLKVPT